MFRRGISNNYKKSKSHTRSKNSNSACKLSRSMKMLAYERAALTYHPDHASKACIQQQVEAEKMFRHVTLLEQS
ncbi:hypothetical protein LINPERHAP2_LOCUS8039 [Linum perenne]